MWNTSTPRFSRCFQKTLPIWLPSLFLWAFAPLEAYMTLRVNCRLPGSPVRPIPVNAYNVGRLLIVGLITALVLAVRRWVTVTPVVDAAG